jgi:hypothetical protein
VPRIQGYKNLLPPEIFNFPNYYKVNRKHWKDPTVRTTEEIEAASQRQAKRAQSLAKLCEADRPDLLFNAKLAQRFGADEDSNDALLSDIAVK